jgi:hypothetical protein
MSFTAVVARFYVALRIKRRPLSLSDWILTLAWLMTCGATACHTVTAQAALVGKLLKHQEIASSELRVVPRVVELTQLAY